ncbi:MAG TPA: hypothetical protein VGY77_08040 [Gemmataceae bacterium]|jgi:probable HAF family extracellular repeat protein|nr:hypothetical protein [Gemmataceae bacterium]
MLHLEPLEPRLLLSRYTLTDLGAYAEPVALNQSGMSVGHADYLAIDRRAAWFDEGGPHTLGSDHHGLALAINDDGWATGWKQFTDGGPDHVFLTRIGSRIDKDLTPDCSVCEANGINNAGQVVGFSYRGGITDAYRWDWGQAHDLGPGAAYGINQHGWVVGVWTNGPIAHGALWIDGKLTDLGRLPGYSYGIAFSINDQGQAVGVSGIVDGMDWEATLWQNGKILDIGPGRATAINNNGQVVGWGQYSPPFLWENGQSQDLNKLVLGINGWNMETANSINDAGQIVGMASTPEHVPHAVRLDPAGDAPFWWAGWALGHDKKAPQSGP